MQTVTAPDGVEIAYEREGAGPPLVCLHGGGVTRRSFDLLRPHLAADFEVVVPDRRGRGDSGDAETYALDREVGDVAALLDALEGDPVLFGHSYGGHVALRAARSLSVDRLALYEPAMLTAAEMAHDDLVDRLEEKLAAGDGEGAARLFFREAAGIENVEALDLWPDCVDLAGTIVRECRAVEAHPVPDDPGVSVPALLIHGEESPARLVETVRLLADRLPDARLVELEGVGHGGHATAAEKVAAHVRRFAEKT